MVKYNLISKNEFTYNLIINDSLKSPYLYHTIEKMLKSSYYDDETNSVFFSAETVLPLKTFKKMSHATCIKFIDDLSKQIFFLNSLKYGFYGFDIDDILFIDGTFILCSTQYLLELHNNQEQDLIIFTCPIKQPYFSSPELFKLTSLPSKINHKCCYYSLGLLVVFLLLDKYLLVGNEIKTSEEINKIIQPLYNTKIYWFIKRCLDDDINNRKLLLV